jgi:hypothetical protein
MPRALRALARFARRALAPHGLVDAREWGSVNSRPATDFNQQASRVQPSGCFRLCTLKREL